MKKLTDHPKLKGLPALYSNEHNDADKTKVPAKVFFTGTGMTWFLAEMDQDTKVAFGWCDLGDPGNAELGYVDLEELMDTKLPPGCLLEVDEHWDPETLLSVVMGGGKQ